MAAPRLLPRTFFRTNPLLLLPRQLTPRFFTPYSRVPRTFFHNNLRTRTLTPSLRYFTTAAPQPALKPSLTARLKALSKEYGYSALGVYLALSALDFPVCFLAVRMMGTEMIGAYEEVAVAKARGWYNSVADGRLPVWEARDPEVVEEAKLKREGGGASLWTELALAYAIHKSFIFIRVPLTAAVTPKVVKTLRSWGWDIGKKGRPQIGAVGKGV